MAVTASTLDAHRLRADFPIFEHEINGKSLAYLDSAVTSQKPRQMLDAIAEAGRFNSSDWLGANTVPAAVIVTAADSTVPAETQRAMSS